MRRLTRCHLSSLNERATECSQGTLGSRAREVYFLSNTSDFLVNMATKNTDSMVAETMDQVKIPEGMMDMAVEDVIPKVWLAFLWRKNQSRLDQAQWLDLDPPTLSISKKTSLVLFHSMTDEEMVLGDSDDGGRFNATGLAV